MPAKRKNERLSLRARGSSATRGSTCGDTGALVEAIEYACADAESWGGESAVGTWRFRRHAAVRHGRSGPGLDVVRNGREVCSCRRRRSYIREAVDARRCDGRIVARRSLGFSIVGA